LGFCVFGFCTDCAPSRCTLLTGKHTGHAYIRDNYEMGGWGPDEPEGQLPLPEGTTTPGTLLQQKGYATCAIGKWGLGGPGSTGHPNKQGFDHWYGYLCQRVAHNYYPTHLWRNDQKHVLEGNEYFAAHQRLTEVPDDPSAYDRFKGKHYAPDLMAEEALSFIRQHKDRPFFLYYATPVPHAAIQVPDDSLEYYRGRWEDQPYLGQKGYLPHPAPRAGYAAMVTRMDRDIGRILSLLDELGLADNTIVMFSSDNGPTFNGGTDSAFFHSAGPLRGLKCSVYEGGIRVPLIACWPGRVKPGTTSEHVSAFWDVLPTLADIAGFAPPGDIDGISFASTLFGQPSQQKQHEYLYWEYHGSQALRAGEWKAVRRKGQEALELYNLKSDIGEQHDIAREQAETAARLAELMQRARTESEHFPLHR
jgi:arylsulfatase A